MKITYNVDMISPKVFKATAMIGERVLIENTCYISINSEKFKIQDNIDRELFYAFEIINPTNGLFIDYNKVFSQDKKQELKLQAKEIFLKYINESPI